jgi:3-oxoadipate enol-lactonase
MSDTPRGAEADSPAAGAGRRGPGASQIRLAATLEGPPGAPVVVLGNSMGTTREVWEPQLPVLRGRFRLLCFEHRGHGGSPAPPGPYTIGDLGADVIRLLDDFGVETASYCGISLGGMIGMWLAANAPERIDALGLCCTSAYLPPADAWALRAAQVRSAGMASISEQVVGRWFTPACRERDPGTAARFVTTLEGADPEGYAGCCEAIAAMDLRPSLGSITAPTLVIAGAEDPATPPWHGAQIASGVSCSRLRVIRGGAHLANVSQAGEVSAALMEHLTGTASRRRWP